MSQVQKQGHFTCPNCGTEAWIWSKKDLNFTMPEHKPQTTTCPDCLGMNRTHPEHGSTDEALSQVVVGREGKYSVYDVCPRCAGKGWLAVGV